MLLMHKIKSKSNKEKIQSVDEISNRMGMRKWSNIHRTYKTLKDLKSDKLNTSTSVVFKLVGNHSESAQHRQYGFVNVTRVFKIYFIRLVIEKQNIISSN